MRGLAFLALGFCVACEFGEGDAKVPGEALGTFDVVAQLDDSNCGQGAMGSTDVWQFQIKLSRDFDQLFWLNGREVIAGSLASDGKSFEFDSWVQVDVLEPRPGELGCTLTRQDRASGQLGLDGETVDSFDGNLTFAYMPSQDSDCTPLIGIEAGFVALPCEMSYQLEARVLPEK